MHEFFHVARLPVLLFVSMLCGGCASAPVSVSKKIFMENAMRDLSTTLCRGIARQVLASAPLRARLDGQPVLPVQTDGLARSLGPGAEPPSHQDQHMQPIPASVCASAPV